MKGKYFFWGFIIYLLNFGYKYYGGEKMTNTKKITRTLIPLAGGLIVGRLTAKAQDDYKHYRKPPFSPPAIAFPIIWPILYMSMGVAYQRAMDNAKNETESSELKRAHYTQLGLNYIWSMLYFNLKFRKASLLESYALLAAGSITATKFYKMDRGAGYLMVPYVMWLSYASYLNGGNWILNKDKEGYSRD